MTVIEARREGAAGGALRTAGPILAVLPFAVQGEGETAALLAEGLVADIATELTRFRTLQVIAWSSALAVRGLSDREAGARLGATHLLRGWVRPAGGRLRLGATLVEAEGGTQLWSEQFEAGAGEVFSIQDEIVARIVATLAAQIEETVLRAARRKPTEKLEAYEAVVKGLSLLRRGSIEADEEARGFFARAAAVDPLFARAQAGLSLSYFNDWSCLVWDRWDENGRLAYEHAHAALDLDDRDAMPHLVIGRLHLFRRDWEQAAWYLDRALALGPSDAEVLIQLAVYEACLGEPELASDLAARAMRLNPYHPNWWFANAGFARLIAGDFEGALALAARVTSPPTVDLSAHVALALAHLGRIEEARAALGDYEALFREKICFGRPPEPGEPYRWLIDLNPLRREADCAMLQDGLRRLGVHPETRAAPAPARRPAAAEQVFAQQGDGWVVAFKGRRAVLPAMKGLEDIRRLLGAPGTELHCLDLADRPEGDAGEPVLDAAARAQVKARLRALGEDLAEAEEAGDTGRAERVRDETDRLVAALSKALGLGGRGRRMGNLTERARSTVTWRIRHALKRIAEVHEPLARHLENSLRTGTFCAYQPEEPAAWRLVEG